MTRFCRCVALTLALSTLPAWASAQQPSGAVTLLSVDGFKVWGTGFEVSGLALDTEGRASYRLVVSPEVHDTCERMLLVMLERPGVYQFRYEPRTSSFYSVCGLTRVE